MLNNDLYRMRSKTYLYWKFRWIILLCHWHIC